MSRHPSHSRKNNSIVVSYISIILIYVEKSHNLFSWWFQKIPLEFAGRRAGDAEVVYASTDKAERELNWK